jgi:hypothetical protein
VGKGDVAARQAQCAKTANRIRNVVRLNGKVPIGPVDTVRLDPVVVNDR